ncbi:hypothetical protein OG196_44120 (plasmid) [Kitasatospora purpeofusca]|uniref:hypothetical protein n=1 Tax=Kitasatospora purpeofusca TaxID=67352 RepID=UPI002E0E4F7C|nr:hypothetical protein OG196_44120 [Kitasatospora purpeofusca]
MVRQMRMSPPEDQVVPELTGLDQLTEEERRRIATRMPAAGRPRPAAPRPAPQPTKADPEMTRRSWYAEKDASDALARAVDDLHHATREPKHVIVSALFRLAADHQDAVLGRLRSPEEHP